MLKKTINNLRAPIVKYTMYYALNITSSNARLTVGPNDNYNRLPSIASLFVVVIIPIVFIFSFFGHHVKFLNCYCNKKKVKMRKINIEIYSYYMETNLNVLFVCHIYCCSLCCNSVAIFMLLDLR